MLKFKAGGVDQKVNSTRIDPWVFMFLCRLPVSEFLYKTSAKLVVIRPVFPLFLRITKPVWYARQVLTVVSPEY